MLLRRNPEECNLIRYIKEDDIESFQLLVDSTINVNFKFSCFSPYLDEYLRFSPCLLAVSAYYKAVNILRYLLVNGADITIKDKRNISVAHFAVYCGDFEILHLLDEYGASFDGTLFTAAERGFDDVFKWILYYQSEDLHQRRKDGTNLIDASSKGGNWKLTIFILDLIKDDLTLAEAYRFLQLMRESNYSQREDSEGYYEYEEDKYDNTKNGSDNDENSSEYIENYKEKNKDKDCSNSDIENNNTNDNNNDVSANENSNSKNNESDDESYEDSESNDSDSDSDDNESKNNASDSDESENDNGDESKNTEDESDNVDESKDTENESSDNENTNTESESDEEENQSHDSATDKEEESSSTCSESYSENQE